MNFLQMVYKKALTHSGALGLKNKAWLPNRLPSSLNTSLEDHPRTRKWLITMVIVSPLNGVIPLINGPNGLYN